MTSIQKLNQQTSNCCFISIHKMFIFVTSSLKLLFHILLGLPDTLFVTLGSDIRHTWPKNLNWLFEMFKFIGLIQVLCKNIVYSSALCFSLFICFKNLISIAYLTIYFSVSVQVPLLEVIVGLTTYVIPFACMRKIYCLVIQDYILYNI